MLGNLQSIMILSQLEISCALNRVKKMPEEKRCIFSSKLKPILIFCFLSFILFILYKSRTLIELNRQDDLSAFISLIIIVLSGVVGDYFSAKVKYPSMLGMLISGMIVRNVFPFVVVDIPHKWTAILWTFSLTAVVARAGLSLKLHVLRENAKSIFLVGVLPILFEAIWLSKLSRRLFFLPEAWSYLLAFGVASISPGVVVPLILSLNENPAWIGSRLPSMMIASVSIDVLVATVGYGISLKSVFRDSSDHYHSSVFLAALEDLGLGSFLGLAFGLVAFMLKYVRSYKIVSFSFMFLLSVLAMGWDDTHTAMGVASCSIIISWATAANTWEKEDISEADQRLKTLWDYFKLFLFPVIGSSVSFSSLPAHVFLQCLCLVLSSVIIKCLVTFMATYWSNLEYGECLFISGIWTGKASVQAALCGAALEIVHARHLVGKEEENYARLVFMCMLSAILIGCPTAGLWFRIFSQKSLIINIESPDEASKELN